jgi:hypothetical protein
VHLVDQRANLFGEDVRVVFGREVPAALAAAAVGAVAAAAAERSSPAAG